ncbi:unnamed protein product [Acanthoscelides obtectus]|uniref:Uncharacterized protein n=1 Tax=Acanthoscelides obtectus TaxID=200917 RepID=A0A9P0JNV1_ACAOB|nr:unnamed protein product [Acanthoscelides obtectus]CAK1661824.1 hypothetical protein AOBTE_LOCUS22818 [Acanthoscelides obtectus]
MYYKTEVMPSITRRLPLRNISAAPKMLYLFSALNPRTLFENVNNYSDETANTNTRFALAFDFEVSFPYGQELVEIHTLDFMLSYHNHHRNEYSFGHKKAQDY